MLPAAAAVVKERFKERAFMSSAAHGGITEKCVLLKKPINGYLKGGGC